MSNIDRKTVESFGHEWTKFSQSSLPPEEHAGMFAAYFKIFPWSALPAGAEGFDMGCGSGRWAALVGPKVGKLNCVDPSSAALDVARRNLKGQPNMHFFHAGVDDVDLAEGSQDFGYSLGVLHHIPDTTAAMRECVRLLKPGAPFLVYLYYRFDNRPAWFRRVWTLSDGVRRFISRLPRKLKFLATDTLAAIVYYPLARISLAGERIGFNIGNWLLSSYRYASFYTMRTDARDRFGTPLEQRFTKVEIEKMMISSGLQQITFSDSAPFWCAVGIRAPG
jgi:SAM-dependent methyltransferase